MITTTKLIPAVKATEWDKANHRAWSLAFKSWAKFLCFPCVTRLYLLHVDCYTSALIMLYNSIMYYAPWATVLVLSFLNNHVFIHLVFRPQTNCTNFSSCFGLAIYTRVHMNASETKENGKTHQILKVPLFHWMWLCHFFGLSGLSEMIAAILDSVPMSNTHEWSVSLASSIAISLQWLSDLWSITCECIGTPISIDNLEFRF